MTLVLGLMNTIGPFATDMYLPAFPAIAGEFGTSAAAVQVTLTVYFLAFSVSQMVFGPASDTLGRKRPIYIGLVLLLLGSIGCVFAPSIEALGAFRLLQGIGAAGVLSIPRAIIRDRYTGIAATQLMGTMMLVSSVAPMIAPTLGSFIIVPFGWRAVFAAFALIVILVIVLDTLALPETLARNKRKPFSLRNLFVSFSGLARNRSYIGYTVIGGLGMGGLFAFIGSSSFVYMEYFGLSPLQFGLMFSVNAIGLMIANQFSARLMARVGPVLLIRGATLMYAVFAVLLLAIFLAGGGSFWLMAGMLLVVNMFFGFFAPASAVLALEEHGEIAGVAASFSGMMQMLIATVAMTVGGMLFNGTAIPMLSVIAICAVMSVGFAFLATRGGQVVLAGDRNT